MKHLGLDLKEEELRVMYFIEKLSLREIAKRLKIGKSTVDHYFKKYGIKLRNTSEANEIRHLKYKNWAKGLDKEQDPRLLNIAERVREGHKKRQVNKIKDLEEYYGMSLKEVLERLYIQNKLTKSKIAEVLGVSRAKIDHLMNNFGIKKGQK